MDYIVAILVMFVANYAPDTFWGFAFKFAVLGGGIVYFLKTRS